MHSKYNIYEIQFFSNSFIFFRKVKKWIFIVSICNSSNYWQFLNDIKFYNLLYNEILTI